MPDEFVKKEVFNVHMQRIDQRFDDIKELVNQSLGRMEAIMERNLERHDAIAADIRADNARINGKLETLVARLDTLQNKFSWNLAWVGIIMGLVLAIVQHFWK